MLFNKEEEDWARGALGVELSEQRGLGKWLNWLKGAELGRGRTVSSGWRERELGKQYGPGWSKVGSKNGKGR